MGILIVGTLAFDSVTTPFGRRDDALGGSASFLATAAAYFGPVFMAGVVGQDFDEAHLSFFASRGINTQSVQRVKGQTFRWRGQYQPQTGDAQTLKTDLNVLESFDPKLCSAARRAEFVMLGNIDPALQKKVLAQIERPKWVALDTMNYWIKRHKAALHDVLGQVDLLFVNESEARLLSGEDNLLAAVRAIRALGPKNIVVKRGEHGALLATDEGHYAAPAFPLEHVCDPTGAGDTFAGAAMGFLYRLNRTDAAALRHAVALGGVMASFVVDDFSLDRMRTLSLDAVRQRLVAFYQLTTLDPTLLHLDRP